MPTPTLTFNPITTIASTDSFMILDAAAVVTDGGNVLNAVNIILGNTTGSLGVVSGGLLTTAGTIGLITYEYNAIRRALILRDNTGGQTALGAHFTTVLRLVAYDRGTSLVGTVSSIAINLGRPVYSSVTGHYYEFFAASVGWPAANTAASARTFLGLTGYLAAVNSQNEDNFLAAQCGTSEGWIGGFSSLNGGGTREWKWIAGPESGTIFWIGEASGSAPNGQFANWVNTSKPTGEPYVLFNPAANLKRWNDATSFIPPGYFVEYSTISGIGSDGLSGTRKLTNITIFSAEVASLIQATTAIQVSLVNGSVTDAIGVPLAGVTIGASNATHIQVSIDLGTSNAGKRRQAQGFRLISGSERELASTRTRVGEVYNFVFLKTVDGSNSVNLLLN